VPARPPGIDTYSPEQGSQQLLRPTVVICGGQPGQSRVHFGVQRGFLAVAVEQPPRLPVLALDSGRDGISYLRLGIWGV